MKKKPAKREFTKMQKGEIRRKIAKVKKKKKDIKANNLLLALRMYSQGTSNKIIAESLEYNYTYISELVSKYMKEGIEAIVEDKRTTNNRRMSYEKEAEFLEGFKEKAEAGELLTIKEILVKWEEETGEPSGSSTIYALLKRHGWRKLKPRPENPKKASEEEIESSKKLTKNTRGYYWQTSETSTKSTITCD